MWMSCSSTLKLRVFQIKECSGKVFVIVGHSLTGALRSLLKSNSQRRGKFSTLSLFFRLPAKKCKNLIKGSIHGPQKRKPSENLKCWRACISVSCIPQGCQWWLQGQDIIFVRSRFKGVHPRVDCRRGHPALTYALMVLEGILDKKCHQSSFFSFLFFHLRSTTKNSSLLALSRVHSHQRPKPLPPLALLWRFSLSCLCLTACSQQHAQSVSSTVSLSLPCMFVFTSSAFNALGSISSFGAYSVSICPILSSLSPHVSWVLSSFHLHVALLALHFLLLLLFFLLTSLSVSLGSDHVANPSVVFNQKPWKQSSQTLGDRCVVNLEKRQAQKTAHKHKIYLKIHKMYQQA